jgi:hypothetical protein
MEPIAQQLLQNNPQLKREFELWKKQNPKQAQSHWQQINWLYWHSPYADPYKNLYPIGKVME